MIKLHVIAPCQEQNFYSLHFMVRLNASLTVVTDKYVAKTV